MNRLKARLSDLQTRLHLEIFDIIALQETRVLRNEGHLAGYVGYHSASQWSEDQSRASVYVRKGSIHHFHLDLSMFSSDVAE